MIIALVNSKGGVGKSTIAGSLAGWLSEKELSVILVDCDAQQSSSRWIRDARPDVRIVRLTNSDQVLDELPGLASEAEFIVCDAPGSQNETSRALLLWADLAIVPTKASMFDARALELNTTFIRQAQSIRKQGLDAVVVLSMVGKDFRLTRDMREAAGTLGLEVANSFLSHRQAFADAPGQASFVWKLGFTAKAAAFELESLFSELLPEIAFKGDTLFESQSTDDNRANRRKSK
jgi:chromosome partitioning protein